MNYKSSTPMTWKLILKPVIKAYHLNNKVNKLLDFYEYTNDKNLANKAYSKALVLQKKSNELLGINSQQCLSSKLGGDLVERLAFPPILNRYLLMDFKKYLENRLMMKELQLMRAEDKEAPKEVISRLFMVVKELRYIYKQLFWKEKR